MRKIICDVCGTSYQESATQCPICGCVRPADVVAMVEDNETSTFQRSEHYTYVRGGRFSKANVQKRNQGLHQANGASSAKDSDESLPNKEGKSDKGLVIAVCALLISIVAVVIYIAVHFFTPVGSDAVPTLPENFTTVQTTVETTQEPTVLDVACTDIVLSATEVILSSEENAYQLEVSLAPVDTTDILSFTSEDTSIATVSDNGEIIAVATGETNITVMCGDVSVLCRVVCTMDEATPDETEPAIIIGNYKAPYKINKTDVSIRVGDTFELKLKDAKGQIIPVTWSVTVADICTVDGNMVTGAMKGKTEVSVTYEGETFTCIVRVR